MPAATVDEYLAALPDDRRAALVAVRDTINANLPTGYEEGIQYGMISWYVPLSVYPDTYNKQALAIASLGSQKNYMALYAMGAYGDSAINAWFRKAFADAGKKLDMGKACVRFKTLDALPLDVIGQLIAKFPMEKWIDIAKTAHANTKTGQNKVEKTAKAAESKAPAKTAASKPAKKAAKKPAKKATKAKKPKRR